MPCLIVDLLLLFFAILFTCFVLGVAHVSAGLAGMGILIWVLFAFAVFFLLIWLWVRFLGAVIWSGPTVVAGPPVVLRGGGKPADTSSFGAQVAGGPGGPTEYPPAGVTTTTTTYGTVGAGGGGFSG